MFWSFMYIFGVDGEQVKKGIISNRADQWVVVSETAIVESDGLFVDEIADGDGVYGCVQLGYRSAFGEVSYDPEIFGLDSLQLFII